MRKRLTEIVVRQARFTSGSGYTIWDQQQKGLGLRVLKYRKTWTLMQGKSRQRITLGHYPDMGLADARETAYQSRRRKEQGIRFARASAEFLEHCRKHNRRQTVYTREWVLGRIVGPVFEQRMIGSITHREVMEIVAKQTDSVGAVTFAVVRALLSYCVNQGYLEVSPLAGKKGPKTGTSRERVLSDDELKKILKAAWTDTWKDDFKRLVILLAYSGQRRGQFAEAQPEWVNWDDYQITFPAAVMKGKKTHTIPYTYVVEELLVHPVSVKGFSRHKASFDRECGVSDWTLHDLRRTFSTICARLGLPKDIVERLMDHRSNSGGVAGVYNRYSYLGEMAKTLGSYTEHLQTLFPAPR